MNIAARLEALAQRSGVSISNSVYDIVALKTDFNFNDLGIQKIKENKFHAFDLILPHTKNVFLRELLEIKWGSCSLSQVWF